MNAFRGISILLAGFVAGITTGRVHAALQTGGAVADALVVAPGQYQLEFENEFVRVTLVRFQAHGKAPMHEHTAPGAVIVAITDQDARLTATDGMTREVHYKAGQVRWAVSTPGVDGTIQSAHSEENLADKSFELIRIDPKVR
jgi:hypothetical protein